MNSMVKPILKLLRAGMGATLCLLLFQSCGHSGEPATEEAPQPVTPVQVTSVRDSSIADYVEIPAVSAYLQKSYVKANITGYVEKVNIQVGQQVGRGQTLFTLVTKEARSIGNTINQLSPEFKFSGVSTLRADQAGTMVQVNHQKGDYVQEGETIAIISNRSSFVFLLDLPYELNQIIANNKELEISLPDGVKLKGAVSGTMPTVDSLAQTQRFILQVNTRKEIPEGLVAKVRLIKVRHNQAQTLPKAAILANETEDEFWVMKLINDSIAVKVKVDKGIESSTDVEVLRPRFLKSDRIITSGSYGLPDTAKVKIQR